MLPVKITNDFVFVKTPYEQREYVRTVLNGVYSKKEKMNRFPKNYHAMRELLKAYPLLAYNPQFVETGKKLKAARDAMLELKSKQDTDGDPRLRPYQRVDVEYLERLPAAGIFNEPRTGKTPTSILLMKRLGRKARINLVVAPASLIWNWEAEFQAWYPEMMCYVVHGTPQKRQKIFTEFRNPDFAAKRVLVVSKDTWKKVADDWFDYTFDTAFVDEAHFLRNHKTAQSEAVFAIKAKRRYALTGTPSVKHATDIWGILHFLYPEKFSSYWQFAERYFQIGEDFMGHMQIGNVKPERQQELEELIGFISVQRKRKEVMSWLPDKQRMNLYVMMEGKQQKLYKQMEDDFIAYDEEDPDEDRVTVDTPNVLSQLTRLRQLCLDPRLLGFDVVGAKTKALLEWLDDNREPVVIMSMFTSYLHLIKPDIEALGLKVGMIHGEMENADKHSTATAFQNGKFDVLLCNIISAGTGFTLDRAETEIFTDKAWNPPENEQAEDRITPTTEARNHKHTIISLVAKDSYDYRINALLDQKKSITDIINEGGRAAIIRLLKGM